VKAIGLADLVDVRDVGVIEGGDGVGFLFEAMQPVFVLAELRREQLDGNRASQLSILREVDLTHPARAQQREDFVATETSVRG
jgi:hypothetical protein